MTSLLASWILGANWLWLSKPGEQVVILAMALLLMPTVTALLPVILKAVVVHSALLP